MSLTLFIFCTFLALTADGIASFFKKWETGTTALRIKDLNREAKFTLWTVTLTCDPILSFCFTNFLGKFMTRQGAIAWLGLVLPTYILYRLIMLLSDKCWRQRIPRSEKKIRDARMIRRHYSIAIFFLSAATAWHLQPLVCFYLPAIFSY